MLQFIKNPNFFGTSIAKICRCFLNKDFKKHRQIQLDSLKILHPAEPRVTLEDLLHANSGHRNGQVAQNGYQRPENYDAEMKSGRFNFKKFMISFVFIRKFGKTLPHC